MLCQHCGSGDVKRARKVEGKGYFLCEFCAKIYDQTGELPALAVPPERPKAEGT